jgi:two-component system alkaline phosphatase synthesis response regulator PhoP
MLTARSEETDRVVGLELGADDYVVKPFSPKELVARIRAVLRRADATLGGGEVVRAGPVTIDLPKRRVTVAGDEVDLTATEFDLLLTLARQPGRIYTRAQLLDAVHGVSFESYERSVDAHIKNLRRKVEPDPGRPSLLLTVYGVGYKFSDA